MQIDVATHQSSDDNRDCKGKKSWGVGNGHADEKCCGNANAQKKETEVSVFASSLDTANEESERRRNELKENVASPCGAAEREHVSGLR